MKLAAVPSLVGLTVDLLSRGLLLRHRGDNHPLTLLAVVPVQHLDGNSRRNHRHRLLILNRDSTDWRQTMRSLLIEALIGEIRHLHRPLRQRRHPSRRNQNQIYSSTLKKLDHPSLCLHDPLSLLLDQLHRLSDPHPLSQDHHHDQLGRSRLSAPSRSKPLHSTASRVQLTSSEVTMLLPTHPTRLRCQLFHRHILLPSSSSATVL